MAGELTKTLQQEIRNLNRDIEALEFQLAEKRKSLELLTELTERLRKEVKKARRRSKQPISPMIMKVLSGRKKPANPKQIGEGLQRVGYVGSPAVMYATLGRLVRAGKLTRDGKGHYSLAAGA
ncbi:hypothetical protein K8I61_07965 [bacterium]|nr:hypothetical protein [bacterium]